MISELGREIEQSLVKELLIHFEKLKNCYSVGDYEKTILNGGKFIEIVARTIQYRIGEQVSPSGQRIDIDNLVESARVSPGQNNPESLRLHIPRFLRPLYDIRNNRGAHYSSINPNSIDAAIIEMGCSWILAEMIRLFVTDDIEETKNLISELVSKRVPLVEEWNEFLTVLNPKIKVPDQILLLLYKKHPQTVSLDELKMWVKTKNRDYVTKAVQRLVHIRRYVLQRTDFKLSAEGHRYVESKYRKSIYELS